jgi:hypothetical protein
VQVLHIITPSDPSTSDCFVLLMRLAQQQIGGEHKTIVIGDQDEADALQQRGIQVLGSLGGAENKSNTLSHRLGRLILDTRNSARSNCIAWGWHSATVLSSLQLTEDTTAFIDEVDDGLSFSDKNTAFIPTSWSVSKRLVSIGVNEDVIAEPLVGVAPKSVVVDCKTVFELLDISVNVCVIVIIGDVSSWEELLSVGLQLQSTGLAFCFVLPLKYQYRANIFSVAKANGLENIFLDVPPELRVADVIAAANCVWAPATAEFDTSCAVLDVVDAAWNGIPVLAKTNHAIASIPRVGKLIACAESHNEICRWIIGSAHFNREIEKKSTEITMAIRSIASPSRFIEGLLLRMTSQQSCSGI